MNAINPHPPEWVSVGEATRIRQQLLAASPYQGVLPTGDNTRELFNKWLKRENLFVCQKLTSRCAESCNMNRCSCEYWLKHSGLVAQLMHAAAEALTQPVPLYRATGLLHDLDYPAAPHFPPGPDTDAAHPVPLVRDLMHLNAPPVLALAILEHSPHLSLTPSSRLSAALIGCDEAATLHAFGAHAPRYDGVPQALKMVLDRAPETAPIRTGTIRDNVRERMRLAFEAAFSVTTRFAIPDAA